MEGDDGGSATANWPPEADLHRRAAARLRAGCQARLTDFIHRGRRLRGRRLFLRPISTNACEKRISPSRICSVGGRPWGARLHPLGFVRTSRHKILFCYRISRSHAPKRAVMSEPTAWILQFYPESSASRLLQGMGPLPLLTITCAYYFPAKSNLVIHV